MQRAQQLPVYHVTLMISPYRFYFSFEWVPFLIPSSCMKDANNMKWRSWSDNCFKLLFSLTCKQLFFPDIQGKMTRNTLWNVLLVPPSEIMNFGDVNASLFLGHSCKSFIGYHSSSPPTSISSAHSNYLRSLGNVHAREWNRLSWLPFLALSNEATSVSELHFDLKRFPC